MPRQYKAIRDAAISRGMSTPRAKELAARTYIANGASGTRSSRAASLHAEKYSGSGSEKKTKKKRRMGKLIGD